jgi:nitric oxide reductase NorE protein
MHPFLIGKSSMKTGIRFLPAVEATHAPGTDGLWTFMFIDMVIFLLIFFTFMSERLVHVEQYTRSQLQLNELFGFANTLVLFTSSWMVVEAVKASRRQVPVLVSRYLGLALLLGFVFVVNKLIEYYLKIDNGLMPTTNSFFSFYFVITMIHLLHVIAGMIFIAYYRSHALERTGSKDYHTGLENVGLFWHLVDVLWIFIFPMLYLVGRS